MDKKIGPNKIPRLFDSQEYTISGFSSEKPHLDLDF